MAQIFLSYARADLHRVNALADALAADGFDVWYDQYIRSGTYWDLKIEEELAAAQIVIVFWSQTSLASMPVRGEATFAADHRKLLPVLLEPIAPPIMMRTVQHIDLSNWPDPSAESGYQEIVATLRAALEKGPESRSEPQPNFAIPPACWVVAGAALLSSVVGAVSGWSSLSFGGVIALAVLLLGFLVHLQAGPVTRELSLRWLRLRGDATTAVPNAAAEALGYLFEAVFSRRHLSWRCFSRSAMISATSCILFLALFMQPAEIERHFIEQIRTPGAPTATYVAMRMLLNTALFIFVINVLGDYLSTYVTRRALAWARRGLPPIAALLIDIALTLLIFMTFLILAILALAVLIALKEESLSVLTTGLACAFGLTDNCAVLHEYNLGKLSLDTLLLGVFSGPPYIYFETFLAAAAFTASITTIWLILVTLLTPLVRSLFGDDDTFIGRIFDARRLPIIAFANVIATLTLVGTAGATALTASA